MSNKYLHDRTRPSIFGQGVCPLTQNEVCAGCLFTPRSLLITRSVARCAAPRLRTDSAASGSPLCYFLRVLFLWINRSISQKGYWFLFHCRHAYVGFRNTLCPTFRNVQQHQLLFSFFYWTRLHVPVRVWLWKNGFLFLVSSREPYNEWRAFSWTSCNV